MADKNELKNIMNKNMVYILTTINPETTNELIMQLSQWVDTIDITTLKNDTHTLQKTEEPITDSTVYIINDKKTYSPCEKIPQKTPVLNVYINSCGGKTLVMQSILTLFNIASAKGAIIKTYNLAHADSSASMIAISGTFGYRYMAENAYNTIHFGNISNGANHINEIEYSNQHIKDWYKQTQHIYLKNTRLVQKELNKYYNIEGSGVLNSKQCLEKGLCDWIITNDGRFVNNIADLKVNQK